MRRRCGREVVQRHRNKAKALVWPIEALADIDTPKDFARVLSTIDLSVDSSGEANVTGSTDET